MSIRHYDTMTQARASWWAISASLNKTLPVVIVARHYYTMIVIKTIGGGILRKSRLYDGEHFIINVYIFLRLHHLHIYNLYIPPLYYIYTICYVYVICYMLYIYMLCICEYFFFNLPCPPIPRKSPLILGLVGFFFGLVSLPSLMACFSYIYPFLV